MIKNRERKEEGSGLVEKEKKQNIGTSQISDKVDVLHMRVFASNSR